MASLVYGADRIHVGWGKVVLLNGICNGYLGLALGLGNVTNSVLPGDTIRIIYLVSLFLLGFVRFLGCSIKTYVNRHCCIRRNLGFSLSGLKTIIDTYGDLVAADVDGSQSLGWRGTVFLVPAISIDSLTAGIMAAPLDIPMVATLTLSSAVGVCMMYGGLWLGRKMTSCFRCDLSWASGVLLMTLVLMKVPP